MEVKVNGNNFGIKNFELGVNTRTYSSFSSFVSPLSVDPATSSDVNKCVNCYND